VFSQFKKFWQMLDLIERRRLKFLMLFMLTGMVLETLSIGIFFPVLALISKGGIYENYPYLIPYLDIIGLPSEENLLVYFVIFMIFVYLLKGMFLTFLVWYQSKFVFDLQFNLSSRLLEIYLTRPLEYHLNKNSSHIIRNITTEIFQLTHNALMPAMVALAEIFIVIGVMALLFIIEPIGTLVILFFFLGIMSVYYRFTKNISLDAGIKRQVHEGEAIKQIQQSINNYKEVKLAHKERYFTSLFDEHAKSAASMNRLQYVLISTPRLLIEFLAIFGLAVIVLFKVWQEADMSEVVPILGVFAIAAFRLLPSVNRIMSGVQAVRYAIPVVENASEELKQEDPDDAIKQLECHKLDTKTENIVSISNVNYKYKGAKNTIFENINLKIKRNSTVSLVGGSGSGKSTLASIIMGFLNPDSGSVKVNGRDLLEAKSCWQSSIGYVPQDVKLFDDSVIKNIAFGVSESDIDVNKVERIVKTVNLLDFVKNLPEGLDTMVGELGSRISGGQRQRLGIARALYSSPSVLIMDEATSSLDKKTERVIMDFIYSLNGSVTIVIITHNLDILEGCDQIINL
jgi:ATP-binding cassette, subfamily B, bacterial PglK